MNRRHIMFLVCSVVFVALFVVAPLVTAKSVSESTLQQETSKDALFKDFSDKKRTNPKGAYQIAKEYLQKYGSDQDENTKYVKEWATAYEAVAARMSSNKPDSAVSGSGTSKPAPEVGSPAKPPDVTGTTWQFKTKVNGVLAAEIFVFKTGGKFQYERYGAEGSSNIFGGTWRQLDENVFATLLGADGNTIGNIRAELRSGLLVGMMKLQGVHDWRFLMESDSVPHTGKEAEAVIAEFREERQHEQEAERALEVAKRRLAAEEKARADAESQRKAEETAKYTRTFENMAFGFRYGGTGYYQRGKLFVSPSKIHFVDEGKKQSSDHAFECSDFTSAVVDGSFIREIDIRRLGRTGGHGDIVLGRLKATSKVEASTVLEMIRAVCKLPGQSSTK